MTIMKDIQVRKRLGNNDKRSWLLCEEIERFSFNTKGLMVTQKILEAKQ
jgi:hypothetical protein